MPRRKANLGRRTRRVESARRIRLNMSEEEREKLRLRAIQLRKEETPERRAARLEANRLRGRASRLGKKNSGYYARNKEKKMKMPQLEPRPKPLKIPFIESRRFLSNLRECNSCFDMMSFGAHILVIEPIVKLEESPKECQFEEVYIKQEVDSDQAIVTKQELDELPEECRPKIQFDDVYIKQEEDPLRIEPLVELEELPEGPGVTLVKEEPL